MTFITFISGRTMRGLLLTALLSFESLVFGMIQIDPKRLPLARISAEVMERMSSDFLDLRDSILTLPHTGSEEDKEILRNERFLLHIENLKLEADAHEIYKTLSQFSRTRDDHPRLMERYTRVAKLLGPIFADLQILYVSLPLGTWRLDFMHEKIKRQLRDLFKWSVSAELATYPERVDDQVGTVDVAVFLSNAFAEASVVALNQLTSLSNGSCQEFFELRPDLSESLILLKGSVGQVKKSIKILTSKIPTSWESSKTAIPALIQSVESIIKCMKLFSGFLPRRAESDLMELSVIRRSFEMRILEWEIFLSMIESAKLFD